MSPSTDARVRLRISAGSGRVTVTAEPRGDVAVVRGGAASAAADGSLEIRAGSDPVEVRCPEGTDVVVGTRSGRVELRGRLGSVGVTSLSGSISAGSVAEADLRTVSGGVELEECEGLCRVLTKSGRIIVGTTGDANVSTVSGSVRIEEVAGSASVRSVSGKVTLGSAGRGSVQVQTVSGKITIRLPAGVRPLVRFSGRGTLHTSFAPGEDMLVEVANVSGAVRLVPS